MMRIAIAGSGGLAQQFAHFINETSHQFIILSRVQQPQLEVLGYQVVAVDYNSQTNLQHTLRGVDLVISTISGSPQINLIDAAAASNVRRFVPAEFEAPPARRPTNDPLDRGRAACLERLRHWSNQRRPMRSTIFSCGVFYERFARGGLASMGIGYSTGVWSQGSYLMNVEASTAEIVEYTSTAQPIMINMISVNDLARYMVAAIELDPQTWPGEFRIQGDRITVTEVIQWAEALKGGAQFQTDIIQPQDLATKLNYATYLQDWAKVGRFQELIATEQRRYDFTPNLNALVAVTPTLFWDWLRAHWGPQ